MLDTTIEYNDVLWKVYASLECDGSGGSSAQTRTDIVGNGIVFLLYAQWLREFSDTHVWMQRAHTASKGTFAKPFSAYSPAILENGCYSFVIEQASDFAERTFQSAKMKLVLRFESAGTHNTEVFVTDDGSSELTETERQQSWNNFIFSSIVDSETPSIEYRHTVRTCTYPRYTM